LSASPYDFNHRSGEAAPYTCRESNKNYATCLLHLSVDQLTEILIFGNQEAVFSNGPFHDVVVFFPWGHFSDCQDAVICRTKSPYDRKIAALVGEKAHRLSVSPDFFSRRHEQSFFVSQRIRCVAYGRLNIMT